MFLLSYLVTIVWYIMQKVTWCCSRKGNVLFNGNCSLLRRGRYNKDLALNSCKKFVIWLETCVVPLNKLRKQINRNTATINYSTAQSMKQITSSHSKALTAKDNAINTKINNPQLPPNKTCPLDGQRLPSGIIYPKTATRQDNRKRQEVHKTNNSFKTRYNADTISFQKP